MPQSKPVQAMVGRGVLRALRQELDKESKRDLLSTHRGGSVDAALITELAYRQILAERGVDLPPEARLYTSTDGKSIVVEADGVEDSYEIGSRGNGALASILG